MRPLVSVSIVSHRQAPLASKVVADLQRSDVPLEIIFTNNVPEISGIQTHAGENHQIRVVENSRPKGFAANHNAAFAQSSGDYFCVLNPDVRLPTDPFPPLIGCLTDKTLGVVAPRVISPGGQTEITARAFPTPRMIITKALAAEQSSTTLTSGMSYPDWVAGMFMLFQRQAFQQVRGFDENYFLYYEDVDICARLVKLGLRVGYFGDVTIMHDARRTSRRNVRYALWHLSSMSRFFLRRALGRI